VINTQAPTIPDLAGSSEQVAVAELTRLGLVPAVVERVNSEVEVGTVIETIPGPGIRVAIGERVQVIVSAGGSLIRVPDVRNLPSDEAAQRLVSAGLAVAPFQEDYSPNLPAGTVIQTLPAPGDEVPGNTEVILTLSNGLVLVPNVVNLTIGEANPLLTGPGLQLSVTLQADASCTGGVVRSQSLAPGEHPQRSTITLVYCGAAAFEPPAPEGAPEG
jgi:serine/threonine-protein kinase